MNRAARPSTRPSAGPRRRARGGVVVAVSREAGVRGAPLTVIERLVRAVLRAERVSRAEISLALVGNGTIRRLNARYLGHRRLTDVIAFGLSASPGRIAGDVYVAPAVAATAAADHGIRTRDEVLRLVVHGVLHVLGYDHPDGPSRVRSAMWRRQEALLMRARRGGIA